MPTRDDPVLGDLDEILHGKRRPDRVAMDWRESIMQRVEAKAKVARDQQGAIRGARYTFNVGIEFAKALNEACRRRDISRVGYIRRAVAAFVAADTGTPFADLMRECPVPGRYTRERAWVLPGGDDDGRGFGTWQVPAGQTDPAGPPDGRGV